MAVPTTTTAVSYDGNESTSTAYVIPFPFLSTDHIAVAVDDVLLSDGDFTVTRDADGQGGSVLTTDAIDDASIVTIVRNTEAIQPTSLPLAGPLPSRSLETALDRALMLIQELKSRIAELEGDPEGFIYVPAEPESARDVATWADSSARASVSGRWAGQLGVQRDDYTIWIADTTTAGDWTEYNPHFENQVVLGYLADAGDPGDAQTAAADLLTLWDVDAALFAGDNNYNGAAGYNTDWAAFDDFVDAGIAYPALGNHDMDVDGVEGSLVWLTGRHVVKFPYLPASPGARKYYTVTLGSGLVDLFVLNSARNSVWDLVEDNDVGSAQHTWFVSALAASRARWKIVMFHHPPVSLEGSGNMVDSNMDWPEFAQADLILCGHAHMSEIIKYKGVQLVNLSSVSRTDGTAEGVLQGGNVGDAPLWADDEHTAIGRLVATHERLTVEVWAINPYYGGARLIHSRDCRDMQGQPVCRESWMPVIQAEAVTEDTVFVATLSAATLVEEIEINTGEGTVGDLNWTLVAGIVELASGTVADGASRSVAQCVVPTSIIPRGSILTIETEGTFTRAGLQVSLIGRRHS